MSTKVKVDPKTATCADLHLHPKWHRKRHPAEMPEGISLEEVVKKQWVEELGSTCICGRQMSFRGGANRYPTLKVVDPDRKASLDNVVVRCGRCAEDD